MPMLPLSAANLPEFERRIHAVRPDSARRWGSLEPAAMLNHLMYAVKLSLEEVNEKYIGNFATRHIVRRIAFHTPLPWPKGLKTPPSFTQAPSVPIDEIRAQLLDKMKRFTETAAREPNRKTLHPMFGMLTLRYWQRVHGKHFNHHFTQFCV
ncbi:MAG TPA: DUF1569 domain-containing protein [Planctomycetota bacterium]|nr:DUF1569 domain-containing protein [Planctomycetota bacterium]